MYSRKLLETIENVMETIWSWNVCMQDDVRARRFRLQYKYIQYFRYSSYNTRSLQYSRFALLYVYTLYLYITKTMLETQESLLSNDLFGNQSRLSLILFFSSNTIFHSQFVQLKIICLIQVISAKIPLYPFLSCMKPFARMCM